MISEKYSRNLLRTLIEFRKHGYDQAIASLGDLDLFDEEASKIRVALGRLEKLSRANSNNMDKGEGFSWEFMACNILKVYSRLLKRRDFVTAQAYVLAFPKEIRENVEIVLKQIDNKY